MLKDSDLTPWFDGNTKPVRVGVYQRSYHQGIFCFSYWHGSGWGFNELSPELAAKTTDRSFCQYLPWRGLAKDPNAITPEEAAQRITDKINDEHASGLDGDPEEP